MLGRILTTAALFCGLCLSGYANRPENARDVSSAGSLLDPRYRQSTGEVCFRMLVQALADGGRSDVVYRMIARTDPPGYGHMLKLGFKTLSERWDKPGSPMNHCMFGHIQEWFQNSIVGIRQSADSVGFKSLLLRPELVTMQRAASTPSFTSAQANMNSSLRIIIRIEGARECSCVMSCF